jgi:short subunit dehydrogenase-like uncharacterized protein
MKRQFDVIVFGATSFVGEILCRYLVQEFGTPDKPGARTLNWAIAGRSQTKLDHLVSELGHGAHSLTRIVVDASDEAALMHMCERARVVVSTVGPYALYGEPLIRACVETGTDYCDLTGEAQWMRRMIAAYEAKAKTSGARIVHCCGFDSIPSDLGVLFLQQQAMTHFGEPCTQVTMRVKAMRGAASGGTVASLVNVVREAAKDKALRKELANPYSLVIPAPSETVRQANVTSPTYDKDFNVWLAPFVMAAINTRVVHRSNAISEYAYGKKFRYDEAMMMGKNVSGRLRATSMSAGLGGFVAAAALAPSRWLLEKFVLPKPGEGPSRAAQEKGFFDFRFVGKTEDGRELRVKVTGDRDPGYGSTGKMLGEAAACMAHDIDKSELGGGFWTPSTAMGETLIERLTAHAGLTFELLEK